MRDLIKTRNGHIALHAADTGKVLLLPIASIAIVELADGTASIFLTGTAMIQPVQETFVSVAAAIGISSIPKGKPVKPRPELPDRNKPYIIDKREKSEDEAPPETGTKMVARKRTKNKVVRLRGVN